MSASNKSLTKEEIRARYFAHDLPIDRHGNYMERVGNEDRGRTGFCALLHYKLIEGMSDEEALAQMKTYEMSPIESKFTLNKAKEFITDVLEINLDEIRSNMRSTSRYIYLDIQKIMLELEHRYEDQRHGYIEVDGHHFQADETSRQVLGQYIQSETAPDYWLNTSNTRIEPFTLEQCKALMAAIVKRDQQLHNAMSAQKSEIRQYAEQRDYDTIRALALEMGLE